MKQLFILLFAITGLTTTQAQVQLGNDIDGEAAGDRSGSSVSLDGNRVAIGAYRNDGNGLFSGHVRIYDLSTPAAVQKIASTPSNIKVFPNPTNATLHIRLAPTNDKQAVVRLLDIQGSEVYNRTIPIEQGGLIQLKDLQSITAGVYVVDITTASGKTYSHKFIKK